MKFSIKNLSIIFMILLIISPSISVFAEETTNEVVENVKITSNHIDMDVLTGEIDNKILSNKEIDSLINTSCTKSFDELESLDIDHLNRKVTATISIDSSKGEIDNLINISLYNFFKSLKELPYYEYSFDVQQKITDSNYRVSKARYNTYIFTPKILQGIDFDNLSPLEFLEYANRIEAGSVEVINGKEIGVDDFKLKIIAILKSYIQYTINNK